MPTSEPLALVGRDTSLYLKKTKKLKKELFGFFPLLSVYEFGGYIEFRSKNVEQRLHKETFLRT